jgi:hypothetical protein
MACLFPPGTDYGHSIAGAGSDHALVGQSDVAKSPAIVPGFILGAIATCGNRAALHQD